MEPRLITAYLLMFLFVAFVAAVIGYLRYHTHARSYARHLKREARRAAERERAPPG